MGQDNTEKSNEWTVSVQSDAPEESAIVRSMLSIMKTSATHTWRYVDSASADLIIVGARSHAASAIETNPRQVVARFSSPGDPVDWSDLVLTRPVRAMPFLELLNAAGARLRDKGKSAVATEHAPTPLETPLSTAAQTLANLRKAGSFKRPMVLVGSSGTSVAVINTNRSAVSSPHSFEQTVSLLAAQFQGAEALTARGWEDAVAAHPEQPLDKLCWLLGKRLAVDQGLAQWLAGTNAFRLIGWPDFGSIGNDRIGFKLSAQLTQRALTPADLSAASGVAIGDVWSFLNSTSLCGLLVESTGPVIRPRPLSERRPEQASLISRLRAKLGL